MSAAMSFDGILSLAPLLLSPAYRRPLGPCMDRHVLEQTFSNRLSV